MSVIKKIKETIQKNSQLHFPSGRRDYIKLDLNESYGFLNKKLLKKISKIDTFTTSSYPEYEKLYVKLSQYTKQPQENICLYAGSDQAIVALLNLFFKKGDEVVIPTPTFVVYKHFIDLLGLQAKEIPHTLKESQFCFPFKETLESIRKDTQGVFLCNPNNPLGTIIPKNELEEIIKKCSIHDIPIIIDEAYFEYYGYTAINYLSKYSNVIILRTFSKAFGLAGLRLGYCLAHPKVINEMKKIKLPWNVSHFTVQAGIIALDHLSYFEAQIKNYSERKIAFKKELEKIAEHVYESHTNFLLCKFNNRQKIHDSFKQYDILTSRPSGQPFLEETLRIAVPSKKDYPKVVKVLRGIQI